MLQHERGAMPHMWTIATSNGRTLRAISRFEPEALEQAGPIALVSGGYDPPHCGHIANIVGAAERGPVVVIVNGDAFLRRKRQHDALQPAPALPLETRMSLLAMMAPVAMVVESIDEDQTVCETIETLCAISWIRPKWFCNGGDRKHGNVPEEDICLQNGVELVWNCGGSAKMDESSVTNRRIAALGAIAAREHTDTRWGSFATVQADSERKVKVLCFDPAKVPGLSLQTHRFRAEQWEVLSGTGLLLLGKLDREGMQQFGSDGQPLYETTIELGRGVRAEIARGQAHMTARTSNEPLLIRETWLGAGTSEEDIERYGDPFSVPSDHARCSAWLTDERLRALLPREAA